MTEFVPAAKMAWLTRLHRSAPECPHTNAALDRIQAQFPDIEVAEEAGAEVSGIQFKRIEQESPWSVEELLGRPAGEWTDQLINFEGRDPLGPSPQGLAKSVEEAATQDAMWGNALTDALIEDGRWDGPIWEALFRAWETDIGEEHYQHLLSLLANPNVHRRHTRSTCRVLSELVKNGGRAYAPALLTPANSLAQELWPYAATDADASDPLDWFTRAINRAAGPLTQFWVGSLAIGLREEQIQRGSLTEPYRTAFNSLAQDATPAGRMGRAALMRAFAFVLSVDETWTREHLVPLLTEAPESDDFQAVWDGLMYGQLTVPTIDVLTESFRFAAANVEDFRAPHTREQFVAYLVGLLIDFVDDPIDGWIPKFLLNAGERDRQRFAWAIWRRLGDMLEVEQQELWNRWLRRYWEHRTKGVPTPLDDVEVEWMQNWLPELYGLFAEGVELALRMPSTGTDPFFLINGLKEGDQCEREPNAVADLLTRLADSGSATRPFFDWRELIERLMQSDLTADRKQSLQELRIRMGI